MSFLFERQSLAVLAVAHGAVVSIADNFNLGTEFQALVAQCRVVLKEAGKEWPLPAAQNNEAMPWVREHLVRWTKLNPKVDEGWRILALGAMATTAITDRYEASAEKLRKARVCSERNHYRKQCLLLDPIFVALEALVSYLRANGPETEVLEATTALLENLYDILEVA